MGGLIAEQKRENETETVEKSERKSIANFREQRKKKVERERDGELTRLSHKDDKCLLNMICDL